MSETISLDWIGAQLRAIQAEQSTLLTQYELTRTTLSEVLRLLSGRIGNFEALAEARIDRVESRLDGIDARLDGIDARLDGLERRVGSIETGMDGITRSNQRIEPMLAEIAARLAP